MTVIPVKLADYRISRGHLDLFAEEHFGRALTQNEEEGTVDYGFEPPDDKALGDLFKMTLDGGFLTAEARVRRDQKDQP